ncbi:amidohydrolase family protein [Nocardia africana]|uniref:Predicted metal-dependent hydrolase of the TIM-barrel fold n=1 Tax=Nocardia africana TaxID=134964 RepID=A0A378WXI9_9NOCA|nr:amidohydrolase family protein [Nocardia africana]MCC3312650.1 amidohydrolase [Nocardia africana]SUA46026.1 Predicted metal-dependent hydrolase of the TIM-barrel fold [Nocardia africana]
MDATRIISAVSRRRALGTAVAGTLGVAAAAAAVLPAAQAAPVREQRTAPSGTYRIDLHAHFLPPDYRAALLEHGHLTIGGYPTPEWSPEQALEFMDYYGIQAQALSVSDPGVSFLSGKEATDMARYCNSYAAGLFRSNPGRFGAFAVLPMPDVAASVAETIYALDELHLDGVILLSAYNGVYLGDPRFEPLLAALNQRNAYVFVHPAAIPDGAKPALPLPDFLEEFTFDTTRAATMMMVTGVTQRYPNIRFQLAHAGGTLPFLSHRIGIASQTVLGQLWPQDLPRPSVLDIQRQISAFYVDTALSGSAAAMAGATAVMGRERIVFGSDWPFSALTLPQSGSHDPAPGLSDIFDADQRMEVEHHNPLRQLPRLARAVSG